MAEYSVKFGKKFDQLVSQTISASNPAEDQSDLIRRAVALYSYLHQEINKNPGAQIAIIDDKETIIKVIEELP